MNRMLAILTALAAVHAAAAAAFDPEGWSWERPIDAGGVPEGFVQLELPAEVFDTARPGLEDLRVVGPDGNLVPHVMQWGSAGDTTEVFWNEMPRLNETYEPYRWARVTLDFVVPVMKDRVRARLSGENYRRRVTVEGSTDNKTWERLRDDGWLFDIRQGGQEFTLDTLTFPANDFRYLRLTAHHMDDDPRRIFFQFTEAAYGVPKPARLVPVDVAALDQHVDDETGETVLSLDLGHANLPVGVIAFDIEEPLFHRGFRVLGRNTETYVPRRRTETGWDDTPVETPWQPLWQGVVYRVREAAQAGEQVRFENVSLPCRYLQVRIANGDNPALNVQDVKLARRAVSVAFRSDGTGPYRLLGGNPTAMAAQYDLARAFPAMPEAGLPEVTLGEAVALAPGEPELPWTERNKVLLWGALLVAVGAVAAVVLSGLRRAKEDGPAGGDDTGGA